MSLNSIICDGGGGGYNARVLDDKALLTSVAPYPPLIVQKIEPFRQYMTDTGLSSGNIEMGIDGSIADVDYFITASPVADRYIKHLSIILGYGTTSKPYLFADGAALTNGCRLFYTTTRGEIDIHDSIKTNSEILRLANDDVVLDNWELRHLGANNDYGFLTKLDMLDFSSGSGIKLDLGTNQKLIFRIRDDVTNADSFNIQVVGFDRFE